MSRRSRRTRDRATKRSEAAQRKPAVEPPSERPLVEHALAVAGLLAVVLLAYANAISDEFVYDDRGSIVENASVHWRELSLENARNAWFRSPTRRAIANWSFGLNYRVSGLDARGYHATNVALHAVSTLLVYVLALHLLRRVQRIRRGGGPDASLRLAAALGAAVFAAHPVATQAVTYVVQRMAGMAALFCLLSLLCYAMGRDRSGGRRHAWWLGALVAWALALGSKESAATFPAVIALYEWLFRKGVGGRLGLRLAGGVVVAGVLALVLMSFNYPDPFRDSFYHDFTLGQRLLSQPRVLVYYASLIAWPDPSRLSLMHDFAPSRGPFTPWTTLPALACVGAAAVWGLRSAERHPLAVFALAWCGITLFVETSVFPLRLAHEHRLYLPLAGVAIAVAAGVGGLLERNRTAVLAGAIVVISALVVATHVRNRVWQDRALVWADVVEKSPGIAMAYGNLGSTHLEEGRTDEALAWFVRAREVDADFAGAYRGIGMVYAARNDFERSLTELRRAVALDPLDYPGLGQIGVVLTAVGRPEEALRYFEQSTRIFEHPRVVNHHGKAFAQLGRFDEALERHRRALALAPDDGYVLVALGSALAAVGRVDEARDQLERAAVLQDPAGARVELASLDWSAGRASAAVMHLRAELAERPDSGVAANNLAWMLATAADPAVRDASEALRFSQAAAEQFTGPDAGVLDTRAAALAAAGRFGEAVAAAREAEALARADGDDALASQIAEHAASYLDERVYLDPLSRSREP